jgi:glyoxylase-like metal-dependent hydrolase (beta-lactamase superfamily II)
MKWVKRLLVVIVILAALAVAGIIFMLRWGTNRVDTPEKVGETGIVRVRNFYVDLYGTKTSSSVLVFDAGLGSSLAIEAMLAGLEVQNEEVTDLFLTHGHFDHFAGTPLLAKAKVHAGKADADLLAGERSNPKLVPRAIGVLTSMPVVKIDDALSGEVSIDAGGEPLIAIPMPGHSPGSYAFIIRGVMIVGDAFNYYQNMLMEPPGVFTEDPALARESIKKLPDIMKKYAVQKICTGHGGCTPDGKAEELVAKMIASFNEEPAAK